MLWFHCWIHHHSDLQESCCWIDREYHHPGRWKNSLRAGELHCLCLLWLRLFGNLFRLGKPTACCSHRGQSIAVHPQSFGLKEFLRHWEAWTCPLRGQSGSYFHTWLRMVLWLASTATEDHCHIDLNKSLNRKKYVGTGSASCSGLIVEASIRVLW